MLRLSLLSHKNVSFSKLSSLRLLVAALIFLTVARAQATEEVLKNLSSPNPNGGLIFDKLGNLYGTTDGAYTHYGTVFKLHPYSNGVWGNRLLYGFTGTTDGAYPNSNPVFDSAGNLYGTTRTGGSHYCPYSNLISGCGLVFKLLPTLTGPWTKKVLYNFKGGTDGATPSAGVIFDSAGNLYGTTAFGGSLNTFFGGTVFELMPNLDGTWSEKILYRFTRGADGEGPGGLVRDSAGNLYGATAAGGSKGSGTIFELSPALDGTWAFHLLYTFCSRTGCTDGATPPGVILDKSGNLYGTTVAGGTVPCFYTGAGCGTAFKLSRGLTSWTFHVIHSFCSPASCPDGAVPLGGLIIDSHGSLYGTTTIGGSSGQGTAFKLSHIPGSPWVLDSVYSFCALAQCADGSEPVGSLVFDSVGSLYGATRFGGFGVFGDGVAFKIIP